MEASNEIPNENEIKSIITTNTSDNIYVSSTENNCCFDPYTPKVVVDVVIDEETITITYIRRSMYTYTTMNMNNCITQQSNDFVFKEVYGAKDNKLILIKTISGRIVPPKLEETYEFDE